MIAIVKIGGHQAIIEAGEQIEVDKVNEEVGKIIQLETLLISSPDGSDTQIGAPVLETKVEAKIIEHGRGKKIRVYKMKQRKRYRRTKGHRQDYTIIEIIKIGSKSATKMANIPIVENHPSEFLDYERNYSAIGMVTNPRFEDGKVLADLIFYKKPKYNEFSIGYSANLELKDGKYQQTEIEPNHLANLAKSRCGIICSLSAKNNKKDENMKIKINDHTHEVSDQVGAYIATIETKVKDFEATVKKAFEDGEKAHEIKTKVSLLAKSKGVEFSDTDTIQSVKEKIVSKMGIDITGKSVEFIDAVIEVAELNKDSGEKKSITTPSSFDPNKLEMGVR